MKLSIIGVFSQFTQYFLYHIIIELGNFMRTFEVSFNSRYDTVLNTVRKVFKAYSFIRTPRTISVLKSLLTVEFNALDSILFSSRRD